MKIVYKKDSRGFPHKLLISEEYNYDMNMINGVFYRWGKTYEDDPQRSPFGPEICDFEIVKGCTGIKNGAICPECYKSNDPIHIKYTTFETFKKVFEKVNVNNTINQVALGLDARAELNPDLWRICEYLRENLVVPNGTVAYVNEETAEKINKYFGAVAVSLHVYQGHEKEGWESFYESIGNLSREFENKKLQQINCHVVACEETYETILELFHRRLTDPWLKNLNAIVLLGLKKCGRGKTGFTRLSDEHFKELTKQALDYDIGIGFDSCSCRRFEDAIKDIKKYEHMLELTEPCESFALFSSYINEDGKYFPCSFAENCFEGIDVLSVDNFVDDVWNSEQMIALGQKSINNNRKCIYYEV
jgi:hypothetical protein